MSEHIPFIVRGTQYSVDAVPVGASIAEILDRGEQAYLSMRPEPENDADPNAIRLLFEGKEFGWVPNSVGSRMADIIAPMLRNGEADNIQVRVKECKWDNAYCSYRCVAELVIQEPEEG
ncbi:MAG: hypothetical protein DRP01_11480 [Archaeoglobales archaeon]|nr:MAG: hypothetical protein DRP01_11480 [Archaeoglobales archaeon]